MKVTEKIRKLLTGELVKYIIFGVLTTLVNFVVYFTITGIFGSGTYLVANVAAWIAAVAFAYVTNKLLVFESRSWERKVVLRELGAFVSARLFSLAVEELGMFLVVDLRLLGTWSIGLFGFSVTVDTLAKLFMQFIVIVMNYVFSKLMIFKKRRDV